MRDEDRYDLKNFIAFKYEKMKLNSNNKCNILLMMEINKKSDWFSACDWEVPRTADIRINNNSNVEGENKFSQLEWDEYLWYQTKRCFVYFIFYYIWKKFTKQKKKNHFEIIYWRKFFKDKRWVKMAKCDFELGTIYVSWMKQNGIVSVKSRWYCFHDCRISSRKGE